jgi:precorrin-4/cobalt-precorrin-4 C11-methyltransferase
VHKVYFVGCGPGDPELLTVKAKKLIEKADVVVYSGSLIPNEIIKLCKKAKVYDAAKLVREEIFKILLDNALKGRLVVRLHDGDPTIYGAIREQTDNLKKERIEFEIVPGITSFLASAAALGSELTLPGVTQTIIITRAESRTKVPPREKISELAKHKATMIFYLSVHLISDIVKEAIKGGYPKSTPAAAIYKASWKDEKIIKGTLEDIVKKVRDEKITRTAIIIVGDVVNPKHYEYSRLYDKTFSHGFRKAKTIS